MLKNLLLAALCLCSALASAQSVFKVTLNPAPYSRDEARKQALDIVLARLSGEQAKSSWVQEEARSEITRYLQSESSSSGYQAQFNPHELQALLSSAGLPFATENKPSILVWLRHNGQVKNEASRGWQTAAERYQQPLLWPLWDLEEHMTLNDQSAFNTKLLRHASARYDADYWLAIELNDAAATGHWQLFSAVQTAPLFSGELNEQLNKQPNEQRNGKANTLNHLMAKLNDYWARQALPAATLLVPTLMAKNMPPEQPLVATADNADELTILVSGLHAFSDSVLLERKLRQLNGVESVYVVDSMGSQGRYRLSVPGSRAAILQALTTVNGLTPQGDRTFSWSGS